MPNCWGKRPSTALCMKRDDQDVLLGKDTTYALGTVIVKDFHSLYCLTSLSSLGIQSIILKTHSLVLLTAERGE